MLQQMRASMFDTTRTATKSGSAPLADALFSELSLALSRAGGLGLAESFVDAARCSQNGSGHGADASWTRTTVTAAERIADHAGADPSPALGRAHVVGLRLAARSDRRRR